MVCIDNVFLLQVSFHLKDQDRQLLLNLYSMEELPLFDFIFSQLSWTEVDGI